MGELGDEFRRSWLTSFIGIFLFCFGIWLLTWNEGRAVHHAHSLDETYENAIILDDYEKVNVDNEGKVIHLAGTLKVEEPLTEPDYAVSVQAVKLKRRVQMYQWVEERIPREDEDIPGTTDSIRDYYYVTEWRDKLVDSSQFYVRHGHENPKEIPLKTVIYTAPSVKIKALTVGEAIKEKFNDFIEMTSDERPESGEVKLHMGIYYHCNDVWNPQVGDIRVQFYYAGLTNEPVTVIAKQENGVLVPYRTSKDREVALLREGSLNINQMFSAEHFDARLETWKLRGVGMFVLYAASVCLARLLKILFRRIPVLDSMLSGEATSMGNIVLAFSTSLIVVAIAWILYRPMLGTGLLFAAFSPLLYCTMGLYNFQT